MTSLSTGQKKFILHWGELGTRWGLNRSVAQIHALLYLSPAPLTAEHLASLPSLARSNVSNSLRELQGWGIVRVVHVMGDRRDPFFHFAVQMEAQLFIHLLLYSCAAK
jgi:DNA-binding transcriptional regulator GbsR (MarR family)